MTTKTGKVLYNTGRVGITIAALIVLFGIVLGITLGARSAFVIEPEINDKFHSHMRNAYYSNTPELMIQELTAAKEGMLNAGLTPDMYSDMRPWKQTPNHQMKWQYEHIDSIIRRAQEVQAWARSNSGSASGQQMTDVYETKMDNLRAFIKEDGWSDGIAHEAYYANFYPKTEYWSDFSGVNALVIVPILILSGVYGGFATFFGLERINEIKRQEAQALREVQYASRRTSTKY